MRPPPASMQHLNGDIICAIDCETTGLDVNFHEIWELAIIPLDRDLNVLKVSNNGRRILPLDMLIKPEYPDRIDPELLRRRHADLTRAITTGFDCDQASGLLEEWVDKLDLPEGKFQGRRRIIPLGQNYRFDKDMITAWLGEDLYKYMFSHLYRDTMTVALFLDDNAGMYADKVPYGKYSLSWLANQHNIKIERAHRALDDAHATAKIYKKMSLRQII